MYNAELIEGFSNTITRIGGSISQTGYDIVLCCQRDRTCLRVPLDGVCTASSELANINSILTACLKDIPDTLAALLLKTMKLTSHLFSSSVSPGPPLSFPPPSSPCPDPRPPPFHHPHSAGYSRPQKRAKPTIRHPPGHPT